jgi:Holliday junction DNA helicase RuvA
MIASLTGIIEHLSPTELVLNVNGVGYLLTIPLSTYEKLGHGHGQATVLTHMHVREDAIQLFGFATEAERELFRMLIGISGIGPKMAQGMLSGMSTGELRQAIGIGDLPALTSIPGIGKKTAERLCVELRDKIRGAEDAGPGAPSSSRQMKARSETVIALMSLGYSRQAAEASVRDILAAAAGRELSVEEMVKMALRSTSR